MDDKDHKIAELERLIALTPGNVYWKDREGKYLGCNANVAIIFKLSNREAIVGKTDYELMSKKLADSARKVDMEVMATRKETVVEEVGYDIKGEPAIYLTRKIPLYDVHSNVVGIFGSSIDITDRKQLESNLKEAKEENIFYSRIIDLLPCNIYWKNREGIYLGCNLTQAKISGWQSGKEVIGKTIYDIFHHNPQLAAEIDATDQKIMANNEDTMLEEGGYETVSKYAVYLTRKTPLRNDAGKVIGLLGVSFDITERKAIEDAIRKAKEELEIAYKTQTEHLKSIELFNKIIDLVPCNIYWKNRQGIYLGCNEYVAKSHGWSSAKDIVGKTIYDIYPDKYADRIHATDENIMSNDQSMNLEEVAISNNKEIVFYTKKIPMHDDKVNVVGLLGVSFDITERKTTELALKDAKEQIELSNKQKDEFIQNVAYLDNIIAIFPGNIYWKNRQGDYLGCNDNTAAIIGLSSRKDIIGKKLHELIDKKYADAIQAIDNRVMANDQEETVEEYAFDLNKKPAIYLTRKSPLHNEKGEVIGLLGVSLDITQRKEYEQVLQEAKEKAEAANQAKSDFLAVVSHELRIPLTAILGMAQLLDGDNLYPEQREQLADLIKSGEHLLSLINDLLDIAKLEAGKMEMYHEPVDLRKIIEEMTNIISQQAKLKGLELIIDYPYEVPSRIMSDARAIRQIILNLTGNAIKFTEKGRVIIKVSCINCDETQATLAISIEDTGIGIAADKLAIIFDRFAQADSTRTRRYGGTGLGLAITKEYVEALGGRIKVQSDGSSGTVFTCEIPFELQPAAAGFDLWQHYRSQVKILIVDDTIRGEVLRKHIGGSLCEVADSKNALNILMASQQAKNPFNIVIIDQQLLNANALQLGHLISQQPKLPQPMLILLAAKLSLPLQKMAKEAGFFDFLIKPIQPVETLINLTSAWEKWVASKSEKQKIKANIFTEAADSTPQILLVEDEPVIQRVHKLMLEKIGCIVEVAATGQQALTMFTDKHYDLILLDIGLPDMDGFTVAKEMRQREVVRGYTPIVGVTGYNSESDKYMCLQAGMDEVAIKPVKPEELKSILQNWLLKSR